MQSKCFYFVLLWSFNVHDYMTTKPNLVKGMLYTTSKAYPHCVGVLYNAYLLELLPLFPLHTVCCKSTIHVYIYIYEWYMRLMVFLIYGTYIHINTRCIYTYSRPTLLCVGNNTNGWHDHIVITAFDTQYIYQRTIWKEMMILRQWPSNLLSQYGNQRLSPHM